MGGGSDITLKRNINPLNQGLVKILALRPVTWQWKTKKAGLHYGFIAQEVENVMPELVNDDVWEDGTRRKFLTASGMMPYVVAALKEQQAQIEDLKKQLKVKSED